MGPSTRAHIGLNIITMTQTRPTTTPIIAAAGNVLVEVSTMFQPTTAAATSSTMSTPVAVMDPLTLMVSRADCHGLIGPSSIGVERVDGSGAAQPGFSATLLKLRSLRMGFDIGTSRFARGGSRWREPYRPSVCAR